MSMPAVPTGLKPISKFLTLADQLQPSHPAVAYYSRLSALELGLGQYRGVDDNYLVALMGAVEKDKDMLVAQGDEAIGNILVALSQIEAVGLKYFKTADDDDRAGRATVKTARTFKVAAIVFDVYLSAKKSSPEVAEMEDKVSEWRKYAMFKAAYISKCLREGIPIVPGPVDADGNPIQDPNQPGPAAAGGDVADPLAGSTTQAQPGVPPQQAQPAFLLPAAVPTQAPVIEQPQQFYPPPAVGSGYAPAAAAPAAAAPAAAVPAFQPPPQQLQPLPPQQLQPLPQQPQSQPVMPSTYSPQSYPAAAPVAAVANVPRIAPAAAVAGPGPGWMPAGVGPFIPKLQLTHEDSNEATKHCKFAISSLQYSDVPTAVDNLLQALKLLTNNH